MAILGVQIVITLVVASIMSKIGPYYSFGRWLLTSTGLVYYMHPNDEELKELANIPRDRGKASGAGRKKRNKPTHSQTENGLDLFNVPKTLDVQLETSAITVYDVRLLRFYEEYQWLIDFSLYGLIVYVLTEVYATYFPERAADDVNLSMVWCFLVAGFACKLLVSLSGLYFEGEDGGERSLVIVMFFFYLFVAMMVLIVDEDTLESGLDEAYSTFNKTAAVFLANNAGLDSSGPASKLVLKFCLAIWCGSIGAVFTFPGLRLAQMHRDVLKYTSDGSVMVVLAHAAFILPLLLTTMWVKPLSRDYLTDRVYHGMTVPMLTSTQFETLRLFMVMFVVAFRLALMPRYLQAYLNMAYHKIEELKQEAGKISNINMQKLVTRIFYYLCVITLQYVAPMVLILFLALMYKTMGGGSWSGFWADEAAEKCASEPDLKDTFESAAEAITDEETMEAVVGKFSLAWKSLKEVFTVTVFRGLLGFSTWWCCLAWFTSSGIGMAYQSYFSKV